MEKLFQQIGYEILQTMNNKENNAESYTELCEKYNSLLKVCKIVMHDMRSPLRFLGDVAESLNLDNLNQPESNDKKNLELLKETSINLYYFATNVLDWFVNNNQQISLFKERVNLAELVYDLLKFYDKPIKIKGNALVTELDENVWVNSNKEISSIIIRNALDNANKYTTNGELRINVFIEKENAVISIQDNGKGFDYKKLLQNLGDSNPSMSQHVGFWIIHDLTQQSGLTYELNSEKGVGTTFTLKYPLKQSDCDKVNDKMLNRV